MILPGEYTVLNFGREPKVSYLRDVSGLELVAQPLSLILVDHVQEDIFWLQIPMNEVSLMDFTQTRENVLNE